MTGPSFQLPTKSDGSGQGVTLQVMPRTIFPGLGAQTGVRIMTSREGESVYEQTVGLRDKELDDFIEALKAERRRGRPELVSCQP